ncbi:hypothetical protein PPERSA_08527 [Pseudocohnilembus persalinus]|uniref:Uncharacterized protein n=1 Tax=Pseudocohnilembus persalinus TaxID=266149 RepID=A0A0V0R6M0_PSEPJ|nr:hypothetical protein PPERSA_08527 [Pseudocohnilembus persalinus]|eukprot:KRX10124.1 hypothetical protein PPERSA_08527 [Pseudocohnilembus persalinus]
MEQYELLEYENQPENQIISTKLTISAKNKKLPPLKNTSILQDQGSIYNRPVSQSHVTQQEIQNMIIKNQQSRYNSINEQLSVKENTQEIINQQNNNQNTEYKKEHQENIISNNHKQINRPKKKGKSIKEMKEMLLNNQQENQDQQDQNKDQQQNQQQQQLNTFSNSNNIDTEENADICYKLQSQQKNDKNENSIFVNQIKNNQNFLSTNGKDQNREKIQFQEQFHSVLANKNKESQSNLKQNVCNQSGLKQVTCFQLTNNKQNNPYDIAVSPNLFSNNKEFLKNFGGNQKKQVETSEFFNGQFQSENNDFNNDEFNNEPFNVYEAQFEINQEIKKQQIQENLCKPGQSRARQRAYSDMTRQKNLLKNRARKTTAGQIQENMQQFAQDLPLSEENETQEQYYKIQPQKSRLYDLKMQNQILINKKLENCLKSVKNAPCHKFGKDYSEYGILTYNTDQDNRIVYKNREQLQNKSNFYKSTIQGNSQSIEQQQYTIHTMQQSVYVNASQRGEPKQYTQNNKYYTNESEVNHMNSINDYQKLGKLSQLQNLSQNTSRLKFYNNNNQSFNQNLNTYNNNNNNSYQNQQKQPKKLPWKISDKLQSLIKRSMYTVEKTLNNILLSDHKLNIQIEQFCGIQVQEFTKEILLFLENFHKPLSKNYRPPFKMNQEIAERVEIVIASSLNYDKEFIARYKEKSQIFKPETLMEIIGGEQRLRKIAYDFPYFLKKYMKLKQKILKLDPQLIEKHCFSFLVILLIKAEENPKNLKQIQDIAKLYNVKDHEFLAAKLAIWQSLKEISAFGDEIKYLIIEKIENIRHLVVHNVDRKAIISSFSLQEAIVYRMHGIYNLKNTLKPGKDNREQLLDLCFEYIFKNLTLKEFCQQLPNFFKVQLRKELIDSTSDSITESIELGLTDIQKLGGQKQQLNDRFQEDVKEYIKERRYILQINENLLKEIQPVQILVDFYGTQAFNFEDMSGFQFLYQIQKEVGECWMEIIDNTNLFKDDLKESIALAFNLKEYIQNLQQLQLEKKNKKMKQIAKRFIRKKE